MNPSNLMTLHVACAEVERLLNRRFAEAGYRLVQSFNLAAARAAFPETPCPYHGAANCSCHLSAFQVYDARHVLLTVVVSGHDGWSQVGWIPLSPDGEAVAQAATMIASLRHFFQPFEEVQNMVIDPVCGMEIDESAAAATYVYNGKTYYFCAPGCKEAFEQTPKKFLASAGSTAMVAHSPAHMANHAAHESHPATHAEQHSAHDEHAGHNHAHCGGHHHTGTSRRRGGCRH